MLDIKESFHNNSSSLLLELLVSRHSCLLQYVFSADLSDFTFISVVSNQLPGSRFTLRKVTKTIARLHKAYCKGQQNGCPVDVCKLDGEEGGFLMMNITKGVSTVSG